MKFRLPFISFIALLTTAFFYAAGDHCYGQEDFTNVIEEHLTAHEISAPQQKLILPRQTNFASQPQTRTISKRTSTQRNSNRYTIYTSGWPVSTRFILDYKQSFRIFPSGLREIERYFISLGRLII